MRRSRAKQKKRKWLRITIGTLVLLVIVGGIYTYIVYQSMSDAFNNMNESIEQKGNKAIKIARILIQ